MLICSLFIIVSFVVGLEHTLKAFINFIFSCWKRNSTI